MHQLSSSSSLLRFSWYSRFAEPTACSRSRMTAAAAARKLPRRRRWLLLRWKTYEANYPFSLDVKVKGMTCEKCVGRVQNALNAQPGTWARVDLGSGMAHILAKSPIDRDAVERAVEDAGYYVSHRD